MTKWIGAAFVIIGALGIGWYLQQNLRRHLILLGELKQALICMRNDLLYTRSPMGELYESARQCVGQELRECFAELEQQTQENAQAEAYQIWNNVWTLQSKKLGFTGEEQRILLRAGQKLGGIEVNQQVELLQFAQEQLEERLEQYRRTQKQQEHLYRSLSLLGGLFLVVLLF